MERPQGAAPWDLEGPRTDKPTRFWVSVVNDDDDDRSYGDYGAVARYLERYLERGSPLMQKHSYYSDLLGYHPIRIVVHRTPKDPKQVFCHYQRPVLSGLIERRGNTAQQHIPFLMNNRRATIPDHFCHY